MRNSLFRSFLPSSGRVILIIITVTAATGGFILGYYVGKSVPSSSPKPVAETQPPNSAAIPAEGQAVNSPVKTEQSSSKEPPNPPAEGKEVKAQPQAVTPVVPPPSEKTDIEKAKKVIYTVQVGASRSLKGAEALKHTLENKGHKAYIKKETNSKGQVIFKVRVGEFENKKDAKVFALKLKKTEGFQTFVSTKD